MKKILIIEDDPSFAKVLQDRLFGSGFEPVWGIDAYQGLILAKSENPDMIILDIMLPAGGGESVLRNLKLGFKTRSIPVLVLTASHDAELKRRLLLDNEVAGFMEKPYDAVELISTINAILQKKEHA